MDAIKKKTEALHLIQAAILAKEKIDELGPDRDKLSSEILGEKWPQGDIIDVEKEWGQINIRGIRLKQNTANSSKPSETIGKPSKEDSV